MANTPNPNQPNGGDPGIHFYLDLTQCSLPESVNWVNLDIYLHVPEEGQTPDQDAPKEYQHHVTLTMDSGRRDRELDLSEPIEFLIPFVDVQWTTQRHFERNVAYKVDIAYNHKPTEIVHTITGHFGKSNTHEGRFTCQYAKDRLPSGMPWRHQSGRLKFEEIIYTHEGVWWRLDYSNDHPTATYVVGEDWANTNFCPRTSKDGSHRVDDYEACFLPYPRLKNPTRPRHECFLQVDYGDGRGGRNRFKFRPYDGFSTYNDEFNIFGTNDTSLGKNWSHPANSIPSHSSLIEHINDWEASTDKFTLKFQYDGNLVVRKHDRFYKGTVQGKHSLFAEKLEFNPNGSLVMTNLKDSSKQIIFENPVSNYQDNYPYKLDLQVEGDEWDVLVKDQSDTTLYSIKEVFGPYDEEVIKSDPAPEPEPEPTPEPAPEPPVAEQEDIQPEVAASDIVAQFKKLIDSILRFLGIRKG